MCFSQPAPAPAPQPAPVPEPVKSSSYDPKRALDARRASSVNALGLSGDSLLGSADKTQSTVLQGGNLGPST